MNGDLPAATGAEGPGGAATPSVTDVPLVPRGPDRSDAATPPPAPPNDVAAGQTVEPTPAERAAVTPMLDPVAALAMAADAPPAPVPPAVPQTPGLLYYAVYLPTPSGAPGGMPLFLPAGGIGAPLPAGTPPGVYAPPTYPPSPPPSAPSAAAAQAHNQKLLVTGIIAAVFVVHLPWLVYLFAVHACWGTFLESCYSAASVSAEDLADPFAEAVGAPMLFARVVFLMLRVQAVLAGDWGQFSQAMQVSTGAGSFILTRIVAANGLVAEGRLRIWLLAASCAFAFGLLFWAELHLLGDQVYPELGAQTVLAYIDQNLPVDFLAYSNVEASLKGYLQFLRLADALILGAALAMPTTRKSA